MTSEFQTAPRVTKASVVDSQYAWWRLVAAMGMSTVGGVGLWSTVVLLTEAENQFGISRSDASLPSISSPTRARFERDDGSLPAVATPGRHRLERQRSSVFAAKASPARTLGLPLNPLPVAPLASHLRDVSLLELLPQARPRRPTHCPAPRPLHPPSSFCFRRS